LSGELLLVVTLLGGFSGQDREARVAALQRRAASAVAGTPEARAVAEEMGRIGSELLAAGETGPALELLGEAYGLDEGNGRVLAELTLASVRAEDLDAARFYLERVGGGAEGAPPEVYRELGEELVRRQRLEDAALAWGEAARLSAPGQDPATLTRLARLRDELAVSRGQRTRSTEHFQIFADPAVADEVVRKAAEGLEASYAAMALLLRTPLLPSQIVILYSGRDYFSLVSVPDWVAGIFDGKIRVSVDSGDGDGSASRAVLTHELAHAVLRRAAGDRAPGWLHEGFAQWSEGRRMPRRELASAVSAGSAPTAAALEASLRGPLDRRGARSRYAQALSLVEHLVEVRGDGALLCVVARLGEGATMDEALMSETGWSEEELFASWKRWAGQ
jgi:Peptidase MA superfamily